MELMLALSPCPANATNGQPFAGDIATSQWPLNHKNHSSRSRHGITLLRGHLSNRGYSLNRVWEIFMRKELLAVATALALATGMISFEYVAAY
jgi:hypothetical protein